MSFAHRVVALLGTTALTIALAGCSGGASPDPSAGSAGQSAASAGSGQSATSVGPGSSAAPDQSTPSDPADASDEDLDQGTVTVEISSGPHAGTHTRSGNLQCAAIGDGRWVMFAPEEGAADEIAHLGVYRISSGLDRTVVDTPYPDTTQLLELKFGSVLATGDDAISISDEVGGTVDIAPPTFDEAGRPIYHFTATTADGVGLKIAAAPTGCPPY
jgi:hypothetical protein